MKWTIEDRPHHLYGPHRCATQWDDLNKYMTMIQRVWCLLFTYWRMKSCLTSTSLIRRLSNLSAYASIKFTEILFDQLRQSLGLVWADVAFHHLFFILLEVSKRTHTPSLRRNTQRGKERSTKLANGSSEARACTEIRIRRNHQMCRLRKYNVHSNRSDYCQSNVSHTE